MKPTFTQSVDDDLDYSIDWSSLLAGGDAVAQVTWSVPPGLEGHGAAQSGAITTIFLKGNRGQAGVPYSVSCQVVTTMGRRARRGFDLELRDE